MTLWDEASAEELGSVDGATVAILPLGAVEAHGPHLPTGTDGRIAEAMARVGARHLADAGVRTVVLPTVAYAPAPFAAGLAGTLSIRPETLKALVLDLVEALVARGVGTLVLANAHFDAAQVAALRALEDEIRAAGRIRPVFPDLTRRALAERLTDEFRSGACHGGRFETSIVLAERPELVDDARRRELPARPVSLVDAIREGKASFEEAGLAEGWCGAPAEATAAEGRETVETLGRLLAEAVLAR